jgi:hypothetical protein
MLMQHSDISWDILGYNGMVNYVLHNMAHIMAKLRIILTQLDLWVSLAINSPIFHVKTQIINERTDSTTSSI